MTTENFREILQFEGYTLLETMKLEVAAMENAIDAHEGEDLDDQTLADMGRLFIIDQLMNYDEYEFRSMFLADK